MCFVLTVPIKAAHSATTLGVISDEPRVGEHPAGLDEGVAHVCEEAQHLGIVSTDRHGGIRSMGEQRHIHHGIVSGESADELLLLVPGSFHGFGFLMGLLTAVNAFAPLPF